jgi:hypothetical protein
MNIAVFWKPVQWVLDKLWESGMGWLRPKSAVEILAARQLRELEIEEQIPIYMQKLVSAFAALFHEHPAANTMSLEALAKALDSTPKIAAEIVRVLVKHNHLALGRSPTGEARYVLTQPIRGRPRITVL